MIDGIENLRVLAEAQGWKYRRTEKGHHQFYGPDRHTIATFSGTLSDNFRGFRNSLAIMKQAGFVEPNGSPATTSLGDAIAATMLPKAPVELTDASLQPARHVKGDLTNAIRQVMKEHPNQPITLQKLKDGVLALRPGTTDSIVSIAMSPLVTRGEFHRVSMGVYEYRTKERVAAMKVEVTPPPAPTPTPAPPPEPVVVDKMIDDDIAELDSALVALARIEAVVKRNRDVMVKFKALKAALGHLE